MFRAGAPWAVAQPAEQLASNVFRCAPPCPAQRITVFRGDPTAVSRSGHTDGAYPAGVGAAGYLPLHRPVL